jgi:hypothetical protein
MELFGLLFSRVKKPDMRFMEINLNDVTNTVYSMLRGWSETGIELIPNLDMAIVILVVCP